jgi:acetoin utilization protein AcuB
MQKGCARDETPKTRNMKHKPRIKAVMTPFPYSVELDSSLQAARKLMQNHRIHHLPIPDERMLVGLLSDREIRLMAGVAGADASDTGALTVRDMNVGEPCIVDLNEPLESVLSVMADNRAHAAMVTRKGKLVGLFTVTDLCRCFRDFLREQFSQGGGDDVA